MNQAVPPTGHVGPGGSHVEFDLPDGESRARTKQGKGQAGKQGEIFFGDSLLVLAPGAKATLTSLDTGTSTTVNISGPGRSTFVKNEDGSATFTLVGTGNWLVFNVDDPSDPIKLVSGRFTITETYDADGNLASSEEDFSKARVVNMCEVLA